MKDNKIVLVGGISIVHRSGKTLNALLQLDSITSKWKEIKLPLQKTRRDHFAFTDAKEQIKMFCGKLNALTKENNFVG